MNSIATRHTHNIVIRELFLNLLKLIKLLKLANLLQEIYQNMLLQIFYYT